MQADRRGVPLTWTNESASTELSGVVGLGEDGGAAEGTLGVEALGLDWGRATEAYV